MRPTPKTARRYRAALRHANGVELDHPAELVVAVVVVCSGLHPGVVRVPWIVHVPLVDGGELSRAEELVDHLAHMHRLLRRLGIVAVGVPHRFLLEGQPDLSHLAIAIRLGDLPRDRPKRVLCIILLDRAVGGHHLQLVGLGVQACHDRVEGLVCTIVVQLAPAAHARAATRVERAEGIRVEVDRALV